MIIRSSQYFSRYQTTTHFMCEHEHDKGPSMAIALELSTMSEITQVHIAHLNILITRLSVHETDHNAYYLVSGNWFYDFIKLSQPIILLQRDDVISIHTQVTFQVGFFQSQKLKRILHTDYLDRVVAFQNEYMIHLSGIQVCHSSSIVTPVRTLPAIQSLPDRVAISGGLYPSHQLAESVELSSIVTSSLSNPSNSNITPTQTPTAPNINQVVWGTWLFYTWIFFSLLLYSNSSINLGYGHLVYFILIQYDYNLPWLTIPFEFQISFINVYSRLLCHISYLGHFRFWLLM